jgi:hypothetical protein
MTPMYSIPMFNDRHLEKFKRVMRHIKLIRMNRRLFWMQLKVHEVVHGVFHAHHDTSMYKDRHIEKYKRVMRHINLISMYPSHTAIYLYRHTVIQVLSNSPKV